MGTLTDERMGRLKVSHPVRRADLTARVGLTAKLAPVGLLVDAAGQVPNMRDLSEPA